MIHRVEFVFSNSKLLDFPLTKDMKCNDLISLAKSFDYLNFVICRNLPTSNKYDVIYSTDERKVPITTKLTKKFEDDCLVNYFVADRNITSMTQRMPFYIFELGEFIKENDIFESSYSFNKFTRKHKRLHLTVRFPSKVKIYLEIKKDTKLWKINKKLYKKLSSMNKETSLRSIKGYRFGTISGYFPSNKLLFKDDAKLIEAIKKQEEDYEIPQFIYEQCTDSEELNKAFTEYAHLLDFNPVSRNCETMMINTKYSGIRKTIEQKRSEMLNNTPFMARMRINEKEPPLKTCTRKRIPIKAELRGIVTDKATGCSTAIDIDTTADEVVEILINKMKKIQHIEADLIPSNFALNLSGTDEIMTGSTPMMNFVCVREFLLSSMPFLNVMLISKQAVIEEIKNKELSVLPLKEPSEDEMYKTLVPLSCKQNFNLMPSYPHNRANQRFSVFIGSVFNIQLEENTKYILKLGILNGKTEVCEPAFTRTALGNTCTSFNETLTMKINISQIPRNARFYMTLYKSEKTDENHKPIATINVAVFTHDGWLFNGPYCMRMWNDRNTDPLLTTCQCEDPKAPLISFTSPEYTFPILYTQARFLQQSATILIKRGNKDIIEKLKEKTKDPLKQLTEEEKNEIWKNRNDLIGISSFLPLVLSSIDYSKPQAVASIPNLLMQWRSPTHTEVLTLLNVDFPDPNIRSYAVRHLKRFSDDELMLYMLQIIQCLKYELYDDSELAEMLFLRGLAEPKFLGHQIFWQLISEAHVSYLSKRFTTFIVNFLYGMGIYRDEVLKGYSFTQELFKLNIKSWKFTHSEATEHLRKALTSFKLPNEFHLPMDPRLIVDGFIVEKCKVMNSKKKPFWLTFHNAAPFSTEPVRILFKVGDDLRQDQLTLQVMKVMNHLWMREGFDFHMSCYGVLPTGFRQGFIEVVPNAITEQELQQERGLISGVLDNSTIIDYINTVNQTEIEREKAKNNFLYSSAGYAVATCVLGIADRHPGNIMLTNDGHYLHIDFGHFLGNFKKKLCYQREDAPFHFSPACAFVFGDPTSETFNKFRELSGQALNILRKNASLLTTLLMLMLGTGIPELTKPEDIKYMVDMLFINASDEEAKNEFDKMIDWSIDSTKTKLNNLFHNIAK